MKFESKFVLLTIARYVSHTLYTFTHIRLIHLIIEPLNNRYMSKHVFCVGKVTSLTYKDVVDRTWFMNIGQNKYSRIS